MDFSQLPKMSNTPKPSQSVDKKEIEAEETQASPAAPREARPKNVPLDYEMYDGSFGFASVWISLVLGLILLMLGANFGRWAAATLSGKEFQTGVQWTDAAGERAGKMVGYFELQGGTAWSDAGLFLMGAALLIDAVLIALYYQRKKPSVALLLFAIFFTGAAMVLNLFVAVHLFSMGILPFLTMGALLVGGMMMFDHVPMVRSRLAKSS